MRTFNNILYVSYGGATETDGLKQALGLARTNKSPLKILVACPEFPKRMSVDFKSQYENSLRANVEALLLETRKAMKIGASEVDVVVHLVSEDKPSVRIVQEVLRGSHDLLVKEAAVRDGGVGFKAIDMALLRKCPCPVWLCRPIKRSREDIRVAVAIDPDTEQEAANALSRRMLQLARSLADSCSGELHIVSCWSFEHEEFLRHNPWAKMSEVKIADSVTDERHRHRQKLDTLVGEAQLSGAQEVHHLRGSPEDVVPSFVRENAIDVLVMGTVARTGLAGFAIGNTAENILQELTCSLIALKPPGFVSPVRAFD